MLLYVQEYDRAQGISDHSTYLINLKLFLTIERPISPIGDGTISGISIPFYMKSLSVKLSPP
jgi:hypothetical protein